MRSCFRDARRELDGLTSEPAPRTFANTLQGLDQLTERLDYAMQIVRHLEAVATTPELRAAYNAVQPKVSEFYSSLPLNEALWQAVLSYSRTEEAAALTGVRKRFLEKTMDNFRRHGAELNAEGKKADRRDRCGADQTDHSILPKTFWTPPINMNG